MNGHVEMKKVRVILCSCGWWKTSSETLNYHKGGHCPGFISTQRFCRNNGWLYPHYVTSEKPLVCCCWFEKALCLLEHHFCFAMSSKSVAVSLWSEHPGRWLFLRLWSVRSDRVWPRRRRGKMTNLSLIQWRAAKLKETEALMLNCEQGGQCSLMFFPCRLQLLLFLILDIIKKCVTPETRLYHIILMLPNFMGYKPQDILSLCWDLCIWAPLVWQILENVRKTFVLTVSLSIWPFLM